MLHVITELSVNLPICRGDDCFCILAEVYSLIHPRGAIPLSKQHVCNACLRKMCMSDLFFNLKNASLDVKM